MHAWLDDNCADGWDITPAGRCVVNDAIAVYFRDAALAAAFAARWCAPVAAGATDAHVFWLPAVTTNLCAVDSGRWRLWRRRPTRRDLRKYWWTVWSNSRW
jgi:hypothetical protein